MRKVTVGSSDIEDVFYDEGIKTETAAGVQDGKHDEDENWTYAPLTSFSYSLICVMVVAVLVIGYIAAVNFNESYITVSMLFSEITAGKNPDESPFDIYELMSDEVLEGACEKLENKIDPETLEKHLWVSGVTTDESFDRIKQHILDGDENYAYYPNNYKLSYSIVSDTIKEEGILSSIGAVFRQIVLPSKSKILRAVADSYKEYYDNMYVMNNEIFETDWEAVSSLDYFNRADELGEITARLSRYLSDLYDDGSRFVSSEGYSFGDIGTEFEHIRSADIENYKSFIIQNGITNNKEKLIKQFGYVLESSQNTNKRRTAEYNIMLDGIDIYDPNVTKVVFIPALDDEDVFYMNRTKIGVDYLTERANIAKNTASEAQSLSEYYAYLIDQFSAAPAPTEEMLAKAEESASEIISKIDAMAEKAASAHDEYISSVSYEGVKIGKGGSGIGFVGTAIAVAKIIILWGALFYVMYCIYMFAVNRKYYMERISVIFSKDLIAGHDSGSEDTENDDK